MTAGVVGEFDAGLSQLALPSVPLGAAAGDIGAEGLLADLRRSRNFRLPPGWTLGAAGSAGLGARDLAGEVRYAEGGKQPEEYVLAEDVTSLQRGLDRAGVRLESGFGRPCDGEW